MPSEGDIRTNDLGYVEYYINGNWIEVPPYTGTQMIPTAYGPVSTPPLVMPPPSTVPPSDPVEGSIYTDNEDQEHIWSNGAWHILTLERYSWTEQTLEKVLKIQQLMLKNFSDWNKQMEDRIKKLEAIVDTENRFKNIIREEDDEEID